MTIQCNNLLIHGQVQGVGFRPFIYREATKLGLAGSVCNSSAGVRVVVEGRAEVLRQFLAGLEGFAPPHAVLRNITVESAPATGLVGFTVGSSETGGSPAVAAPVDVAPCTACLQELFDPGNRRYLYPFITCCECGPRFTVTRGLPFDRGSTSMAVFMPCPTCVQEYNDPDNRRFHAQTISCFQCGPTLNLCSSRSAGDVLPSNDKVPRQQQMIREVVAELRKGAVVALKGVGGYQFVVDGSQPAAVGRLRAVKHRRAKPFAIMVPSLAAAEWCADVTVEEKELLASSAAPIVLLKKNARTVADVSALCAEVAPDAPWLGVMLPSSPLHHLIMTEFAGALVVTSANRSHEPICIDDSQIEQQFGGSVDWILSHDRAILHRADDSVTRVVNQQVLTMRLGRGLAPLLLPLHHAGSGTAIGVGAQEKCALAMVVGNTVVLSPHIGDLDSPGVTAVWAEEAESFSQKLLNSDRPVYVGDLHPDYWQSQQSHYKIQHHHAHVLACLADNDVSGPVLGIAWDGSGLGPDGTIWGGEFLQVDGLSCERLAHLLPFQLPGGATAIKEPRRSALGILSAAFSGVWPASARLWLQRNFSDEEARVLRQALQQRLNCPLTSSAGRLFDAAASLLQLCQKADYQEQAPALMEGLASSGTVARRYTIDLVKVRSQPLVLDWRDMFKQMLADAADGESPSAMARGFHSALADAVAKTVATLGFQRVALTGGVFQNALLTEMVIGRLQENCVKVYTHKRVPPGDGGIAVGQALYGVMQNSNEGGRPCV